MIVLDNVVIVANVEHARDIFVAIFFILDFFLYCENHACKKGKELINIL